MASSDLLEISSQLFSFFLPRDQPMTSQRHRKSACYISFHVGGTHMNQIEAIHERALKVSVSFAKGQSDLLEILTLVSKEKVYKAKGYESVFKYCTLALNLSEDIALTYIAIARKSLEIPEIKECVKDGSVPPSRL